MKEEKNSRQPAVIHFDYEGNPVSFMTEGRIMVNATEMAKPFGKRVQHWLETNQSKEFIQTLVDLKNSKAGILASGGDTVLRICSTESLVQVKKGGAIQGTWMHENVALEFARRLSPKFGIWCNNRIKELLTKRQININSNQTEQFYRMETRVSILERALLLMDNDVRLYRTIYQDVLREFKNFKEDLYNSDEYSDIYTGLNNQVVELQNIIEDKERIIRLQSKQLDVWKTECNRLQPD